MFCEPFVFRKWYSSALHNGTSQNTQKPPWFSNDLQRRTNSGGGNRSSGRRPILPVRSISSKTIPKSPQLFLTVMKMWSRRQWVRSWQLWCYRHLWGERELPAAEWDGRWTPCSGSAQVVRGPLCPAGMVRKVAESVVSMRLLVHLCLLTCSLCSLPHSVLQWQQKSAEPVQGAAYLEGGCWAHALLPV